MTFNIHWLTFLKTASTIKQRTYSCCLDSKQEITYLDGANLKRKKLQKNYWHEFCIISFSCSINHEIMRYIQNVLDRNKIWKLVTFVLTDNGFETENLKNWGRYLRSPSPSLYKAVHTSVCAPSSLTSCSKMKSYRPPDLIDSTGDFDVSRRSILCLSVCISA